MIAIAGGGLSGLACAWTLHRAGVGFNLYEAAPQLGGRQRTTKRDGFTLDHGFQVVLSSYDAVAGLGDVANLNPCWFESAALLHDGQRLRSLASPLVNPAEAIFSPALCLRDKLLLVFLGAELLATPAKSLLSRCASSRDISTRVFLRQRGFSQSFFDRFAQPFIGGVLLDNNLESSAGLFLYYLKKFLTGRAWIPSDGIAALPESLAAQLPRDALHFNSRVTRLSADARGFELENGDGVRAEKIILALDEPSLCRVLGRPVPPEGRGTSVVYFKTRKSLYDRACLLLPEGGDRVVRHFVQITNVAPEFAPPGWHLISATVLDSRGWNEEQLADAAAREIALVFPDAAGLLEHIETIHVPYAVPLQPPGFAARNAFPDLPENVYACGDWKRGASIQAAIQSGIETAQLILAN